MCADPNESRLIHLETVESRTHMTPNDVKELLKTLIAEEGLPIDVVDIAPDQDYSGTSGITLQRIALKMLSINGIKMVK